MLISWLRILMRRRTLPRLRTLRLLLMPLLHLLRLLLVFLLHLLLALLVEVPLLGLLVFLLLLLCQPLMFLVLLLDQLLLLLLILLLFPRIPGVRRLLHLVWLQVACVRRRFRRTRPVFWSRLIPTVRSHRTCLITRTRAILAARHGGSYFIISPARLSTALLRRRSMVFTTRLPRSHRALSIEFVRPGRGSNLRPALVH